MGDTELELQRVEAEERELVLDAFTNEDALALGLSIVERARERGLPIAIDVERGGQRLFHAAMAGSSPDNAGWIERKKALVRRVFKSSYAVGLKLRSQGRTIEESLLLPSTEYAPHGGCVPLVVKGVGFVGTVTVSGLPQKQDHELVVECLRAFISGRRGS
jgi:uncharacterized protein (UPF0303 family)